jgi:hypothetical protein
MAEITYRIFPSSRLVVVRFVGNTTVDDLAAVRRTISADPSFDLSFQGIGDLRAARYESDFSVYRAYVEQVAARNERSSNWAVLIETPKETAFQMVWQSLMEKIQPSKLFITPEAAVGYLSPGNEDAEMLLALLADPRHPLEVRVTTPSG